MDASIDWSKIQKVFLDLDGTLLDLHFDNDFWRRLVPERYAQAHRLSRTQAHAEVMARYRRMEGTLEWYCVDHWTQALGLDILRLKGEVKHRIRLRPHVRPFLEALKRRGIRRVLVTNAHPKSLEIKLAHTGLRGHLDRILCAHDLGLPKEAPGFWTHVARREPFSKEETLLIDDHLAVLQAAKDAGFRQVLAIRQPDSQQPARTIEAFPSVLDFDHLLPGLLRASES